MALPWAAPEIGDIAELKNAGAAGIVYPVNDVAGAARACQDITQQLPKWTHQATLGRDALKEKYSLDRMTRSFYGFLDQIA
jgi:hypothetical protein